MLRTQFRVSERIVCRVAGQSRSTQCYLPILRIETLSDVMLVRGIPDHIRSDNGPEMIAKLVRDWLSSVGAKTLFI
jgi:hypothetical protein